MGALSWSTASRIAIRELRSSRSKFMFVVLSVSIGVAALTGVRGFSASFRRTLLVRARSILAADVSARMFQQPDVRQAGDLQQLARHGVRMTPVTEMAGMVTAYNSLDPLLVALKAVDPASYPFYGDVQLEPKIPLQQALQGDNVAVGEDLLIRLHLHIGDRLQLGDAVLRISATVLSEPDRLSGSFAAGPRILMTQRQLDATHLLQAGSRAGQRYLFQLPARNDQAVAALKASLENTLPEAQVTDYRESNPAVTTALDRATAVLSLVSLVALVLGAVGVAMAMRTHLLQRLDSIAIMKSLGAQSWGILRIYFLQTLALGTLGGLLGVVLGAGVQATLPLLLAPLLGVAPEWHLDGSAILVGIATGLVTTTLFTLPPLLDIRGVRPLLVLRRDVEDHGSTSLAVRIKGLGRSGAQIAAAVLITCGIAVISTALSDSKQVGAIFTAGLVAVLLVLLFAAWLLLYSLRELLRRTRGALPHVVRHGLANLYRPGNPSAALLAALGLGVMQIATIFLLSHALVQELDVSTQPKLPNVFLIDIAPNEIDGVRTLLHSQAAVQGTPEMLPVVASRILKVDGVPAAELKLQNFPQRMLQSISLSWTDGLPPGDKVLQGHFWSAGEQQAQLAIGQRMSTRLHAGVGSHVLFAAPGDPDHPIDAVVAAIVKSDGQHAASRAEFLLPRAALQSLPTVWYGGVHVDVKRVGEVQRALFARYPTVTVINVAQALETLRSVLLQVSFVVQTLVGFSVLSGTVILASAIAGTRYRRVREVVTLKTLGATRLRIGAIFSIEFAILGLVAGVVGLVFANLTARLAMEKLDLSYHVQPVTDLIALAAIILLTMATGWIASYGLLGQRPLEVLREQ